MEHGDWKIKINSGFRNSYGPMRVYESYGLRTIRNNNYSYDVPLGRPESGIIIIRTVEASTGFRNNNYSYDVSLLGRPESGIIIIRTGSHGIRNVSWTLIWNTE